MSQCKLGLSLALALVALVPFHLRADGPSIAQQRIKLTKDYNDGNWAIAYNGLRKLALDPNNEPLLISRDFELAVAALDRLGRNEEIDDFRETVVKVHAKNWRLLASAAKSLADGSHGGIIVAGSFKRGHGFVSSTARDRVRALQLLHQAIALSADDKDRLTRAELHLQCAGQLLYGAWFSDAWHLQYLTDLTKFPDYEQSNGWQRAGTNHRGAPVDEAGNPVLHYVPKTYADAKTDGERWRWMLARAIELDPSRASQVDLFFADFMQGQLGVQTLTDHGWSFAQVLDRPLDKSSVSALHTLKDDETIANLATGVKRFRIPAEFNWLKIYQRVADRARARDVWAERALDSIAQEFEDRRQYPRAAEVWKVVIKEYGAGHDAWRKHRMEQIVGNWGQFETTTAQTAGQPASLDFRFRNGKKLALEAHAIDVPKFLADVKAYIASKPANGVDDNRVDTSGLGRRLTDIKGEEKKYSLGKVAEWSIDLKPRPNHFDEQVSIKTPLTKPGAYLVKARVADGNLSQILAWISDTIIVKTEMKGETLYYVADAVTGAPIADATVDFFGWYQEQVPNSRIYKVFTTSFKKKTNKDGLVAVLDSPHSNWLVTAVKAKDGPGGADRFAFLGPTRFWNAAPYDTKYEETRTLVITDRPVYRPEHKVHFKVWVQQPRYEKPNASEYAGSKFNVIISDPLGNKVSQQPLKADKFGGIAGEYRLPKDAPLGAYDVVVRDEANDGSFGGSTFRVEEYKKPEFEVKVNAPTDPVKLGDKFTASVEAKYLFGAPVVGAVVKYKVLRTPYTAQWFPAGPWDWLYGRGYGWLSSGFTWYPGFDPWAWNLAGLDAWGGVQQQPEIVSENEVRIGPGGKLDIVIDTSAAKSLHPNQDHQYSIMAEVTDASRRTIVGTGGVAVARQPFQVHVWLDRGHYRVGDTIEASCVAHTLDSQPIISEPHDRGGRARRLEAAAIFIDPADAVLAPVKGNGTMTLYRISYNAKNEPVETQVEKWDIATNADGEAGQRFKVQKPGQYRLSCKVDDAKKNTIEGSYFFLVAGEGFDGKGLRFNDIEIVPDKRTYAPGDKVKLNINVNKSGATVLLFVRPRNGYYPTPKMLHLKGKSIVEEIEVVDADMPNFFVEAFTIADGRVHSAVREIIVPPAQRVVNVEVLPAQKEYRPGQKAVVKVKLSQLDGKPFQGAAVVSVYDKSVEYISGGTNVPEIKAFFWQWVRSHHTALYSSVIDYSGNLVADRVMEDIGMFGSERILPRGRWYEGPREVQEEVQMLLSPLSSNRGMGMVGMAGMMMGGMPGMMMGGMGGMAAFPVPAGMIGAGPPPDPNMNADPMSNPWPAPPLRKNFADTAYWNANLVPNKDGIAELSFTAPDQLTTWKIHAWAMGLGTRVGEGAAEVVTKKDLIVRLQAPRFFVQKDEVVLSANVHNYLQADKKIRVSLELDGGTLSAIDPLTRMIEIVAGGEQRVDWRVKAVREGDAIIRMKAVCDVDADAMEMRFPVFVHGMLKTDSYTGVIRPGKNSGTIVCNVPADRRPEQSVLEVRYSPTLAGAMVDALPYLVDYPYGCTEQTLNRFVPTVVAQNLLLKMKLDLKDIEKHRTNLNAGEIGDDKKRVKDWQRVTGRNPVFNIDEVRRMSQAGVDRLANQQNSDGGWGWFSGANEQSWPHTTAVVVRGLLLARDNKVELPGNLLEPGITWLKDYQKQETRKLRNAASETYPWKKYADNADALVYMTLVEAGVDDPEMRDFLYRDRAQTLSVYAKAMLGLALHKQGQKDKLAMVMKNLEQFLVTDDENQTAHLRLPADYAWWHWHGDEIETNAIYLKLLARTGTDNERASQLVKYLLNNRRHATYWRSTRDTALCIEAFADYLNATGEVRPDMTVEVWVDGQKHKEVRIDKTNLFSFDNKLVLQGDKLTAGKHTVEIKRKGSGPVYYNAYLTYFTLEDDIKRSGLEIKVNRKYYKLTRIEEKVKVSGARGQALEESVEKYVRSELKNLATLKSGDLVEVELEIDTKNDYEYLIFEDMKAGGFEPLSVQSGYVPGMLGAYMELRDEKVAFFVRDLPRGKHSISYQLRAETPGVFSALPTRAHALYAPELKANSDEIKLRLIDR